VWRVTLTRLLVHRVRFVLTALAVVLGVAFLAGTLVLTDTISRTFDSLFLDVYRGTDAVVRMQQPAGDSFLGFQRPPVPASLIDQVRAVPGVSAVAGMVTGYAQLVGENGAPIGNPTRGAPTLGGSWVSDARLNPYTLVPGGHPPHGPDQVVIDRASAIAGHLHVGSVVTVLTRQPPRRFMVVGLLRFGTADSPLGASVALFDTSTAQQVVGQPGTFDEISVAAAPGVSQTTLQRRLRAALHVPGIEVLTGAQVTADAQSQVQRVLSFFDTFLLVFAAVALFVGAFIISNTFSIVLAQRLREHALLRAIGATRRQILLSVLGESAVVGLLSSAAGLAVGVVLAVGLKAVLHAAGVGIPATGLVVLPRTAVAAFAVGTGVTVASSILPGWRARRVPPIAALRELATEPAGTRRGRVLAGGVLGTAGLAALAGALIGSPPNAGWIAGGGAAAVFLAVATLGPVGARPLSRALGWPVARLRGIPGTVARDNALRNPRRTAATASALVVGVALVVLVDVVASSVKASVASALDRSLRADLVLTPGTGGASFSGAGISPALAQQLRRLPQVAVAAGVRAGLVRVDGNTTVVLAADPAAVAQMWDLEIRQGSLARLGPGDIAVSVAEADAHGWHLGQRIPVVFAATGTRQLAIGALYASSAAVGSFFLSLSAFEANAAQQLDAEVFVKLAPGVPPAQGRRAVEQVARAYPNVVVQDQAQYRNDQLAAIDQVVNLVDVLLALALLIALIGIANTLALSVIERTRELGLLRAVGATRAQLRSAVRWESVIIAVLGGVTGIAVGLGLGWAVVVSLEHSAGGQLTTVAFPLAQPLVVAVAAGVAGVAAAVAPSRRAARLDVLAAIASE